MAASTPQPDDWPLLKGIWRILRSILAAIMLGLAGALVFGFTLGILTITGYGIGIYLGIPLGLIFGIIWSIRIPATDSAFIFATGGTVWIGSWWLLGGSQSQLMDLLSGLVPPAIASLFMVLAFGFASRMPRKFKRWFGALGCLAVLAYCFGWFVIRIYRT